MTTFSNIRNIIFDLGGVILNIDYHLTANAFKNLGLENFDSLYTQAQQSGLFDDYETGKISENEFIITLKQKMAIECSENQLINAWNAMLLDFPPERLELIKSLRPNYRIFLLSNTNHTHQQAFERILEQFIGERTLDNYFEKVYFSHLVGKRKPNSDIFNFVLGENKLVPEETLFIDDSSQHIVGAQKVGIKAVLLENEDVVDVINRLP